MGDIERYITDDLVERHLKEIDGIIMTAFLEKFGFPITDVKDKENLRRISVEGSSIESYQYRGQTFLVMDKEITFEYETSPSCDSYSVTLIQKHKSV